MTDDRILSLRKEYQRGVLDERGCSNTPIDQFELWLKQAIASELVEPNAMALATVSKSGKPSVRMVLLKRWSSEGLDFFTNFESRKGVEISENNRAALLFYWGELERQIRIEGEVARLPRIDGIEYFNNRPLKSRVSAAISKQSRVIDSREELVHQHRQMLDAASRDGIECPENWGGYRLKPDYYEFWQGREDRLHDRIVYRLTGSDWDRARLAP